MVVMVVVPCHACTHSLDVYQPPNTDWQVFTMREQFDQGRVVLKPFRCPNQDDGPSQKDIQGHPSTVALQTRIHSQEKES